MGPTLLLPCLFDVCHAFCRWFLRCFVLGFALWCSFASSILRGLCRLYKRRLAGFRFVVFICFPVFCVVSVGCIKEGCAGFRFVVFVLLSSILRGLRWLSPSVVWKKAVSKSRYANKYSFILASRTS